MESLGPLVASGEVDEHMAASIVARDCRRLELDLTWFGILHMLQNYETARADFLKAMP